MTWSDIFERYAGSLEPIATGCPPTGSPRHPVKALLFDVYGTLFISASGDLGGIRDTGAADDDNGARESGKLLSALATEYGSTLSPQKLLKAFIRGVENEHQKLKNQGMDYPEVQVDKIWKKIIGFEDIQQARRFALSFELIINPVHPMPHSGRMLARVHGSGIKTGIISNAQFYTPLMFEYYFGRRPENMGFDPALLVYSYREGRAKPSPVLFGKAVERLSECGIPPENVLFIGNDMLNDIFPAQAIGFQTALFAGDKRSLRLHRDNPCCRDTAPDLVITDLSQLPDMAEIR